ncbi:hypothetical protein MTP99_001763 [Tenebrio molitor]|nr:hypothetical protein MTP99_001763 [Tenebrio molitor]
MQLRRPESTQSDFQKDTILGHVRIPQLRKHLYIYFIFSWYRILPTGKADQVNQVDVDYHKNLISALKSNGIEPFVTLYHWDLPKPLEDIGGWLNETLVDCFADYARLSFTLFGEYVKNWMTFNEADQFYHVGYGYGAFPPGIRQDGIDDYLCGHTVLKFHAKAYHIYGRVSMVVDTEWYEFVSDSDQDKEAADRKLQFTFGWFANAIYLSP